MKAGAAYVPLDPAYPFSEPCLVINVAKPVGIPAKTTHHYNFRTFFSVLHHFQDRLMADAGAPAGMR